MLQYEARKYSTKLGFDVITLFSLFHHHLFNFYLNDLMPINNYKTALIFLCKLVLGCLAKNLK